MIYCNNTKNTGNNLEINGILSNNNKQESHLSILDINQIQNKHHEFLFKSTRLGIY